MKINIYGDNWDFNILETDRFIREFNEHLSGMMEGSTKQVFFSEDDFDEATVIHEVCHVYIFNMCMGSATLTTDQMEEMFCDLMAQHGRKILRQSRQIYKALKDDA